MPAPTFRRRLSAAALGLGFLLTLYGSGLLSPRPAPRYAVTDLGVLPGDTESSASAINSRGEAVGFSHGTVNRACLFQGGKVTSLGVLPGGSESDARGINSRGEVTGYVILPTAHHAFLYSQGRMLDLGTLPGFNDSRGSAINDWGEVVGNAGGNARASRGFLYSHGRMADLGILPGISRGEVRSINSASRIAGGCYVSIGRVHSVPFLYDSRTKRRAALPMPPPYTYGYANGVNDRGQIIGDISATDEIVHTALWGDGRMTDLEAPSGYTNSIGSGLNNRGEVVGRCFNNSNPVRAFLRNHVGDNALGRYLDGPSEHAFVYSGGRMQDLNELIPADADWTLESARGINDRGQIVGVGLHHGQQRAFLLTPIR